MAAMLAREPVNVPQSSSVPAGFFEHLKNGGRKPLIEVTLTVGSDVDPVWPFEDLDSTPVSDGLMKTPDDTREKFAAKVTTSRRFTEVMVNRVWQRYMGAGIVEPVNDWEGNAPSDPALLANDRRTQKLPCRCRGAPGPRAANVVPSRAQCRDGRPHSRPQCSC